MAENKTPELRFEGFEGEWDKQKLGTVFGTTNERNHPELPVASASQEYGMIIREQLGIDISYNKENAVTYKKVEPGNYVIHLRSFQGGFAHSKVTAITSPAYTIMEFLEKEEHDDLFWKYLFTSDEFIERLKIVTYGIRDGRSINYEDCAKLDFIFPKESEQQQIGLFFKNLDQQILLTQEKLEKTKTFKKTMLQKMFPQEGSKVPEIRLEGFSGEWEEKCFDKLTYPSGIKNRDNIDFESYSITNENGFVPQNEQFENGGNMATADKSMYYIVSKNSFAYNPARINVGSIGYYEKEKDVIVSSLYEVFKTTDEIDDHFLMIWFKTDLFQQQINMFQEGGVRLYFYYDKLCMSFISLPTLEEQKAISNFFDNLSEMITTQSQKLDLLKTLKRSFLNKMFV